MRRRIVCATTVLLALGLALGAATGGVAAQDGEYTVETEFEDEEIDAGETTRLNLTLDEVPEKGVYGVTLELNLDGDVAVLTGEYSNDGPWGGPFAYLDLGKDGDNSTASVITTDLQGDIDPNATDLDLGSVEVVGVGDGSTEANVSVESLENRNETQVERSVDPATLAVDGPSLDAEFADESVLVGGTTELTLTLDEAPSSGVTGATTEIALDGSVAELTGDADLGDEWTADVQTGDDDATAVVNVTATGDGAAAGTTDVELATLTVETVAEGSTTADLSVESVRTGDSLEIQPTVGSDALDARCHVGDASNATPITASVEADSVEPGATADANVQLEGVSRHCYDDASFEVSVDNETATFTGDAEALANGTNVSVDRADANATAIVDADLSATSGASPAANVTLASLELDAVATGTTNVTVSNVSVGSGNDSVTFASSSTTTLTVAEAEDEEDDSGGGGGGVFIPVGGGDDTSDDTSDVGSDDGEDGDDADEAPPEFALSLDSSTGPMVVFSGENARADATATADVGTSLGGLQLSSVEATAASESESFQLTVAAGDRSGPDVDGDVVQTLTVDGDGVLDSAALSFSVEESAVAEGADADDLTVYRYSDGQWSATAEGAAGESFSADLDSSGALAVVAASEQSTDGTASDDGLGIPGLDVVLALLALATVFAVRVRATE